MENTTLDENFETQYRLDGQSQNFLKETAKWGRFLAILGFVMIGLMVLIGVFMGTIMSNFGSGAGMGAMPVPPWAFTLLYLVFAGFYILPTLYLYKFSTKTLNAFKNDDPGALPEGFENLKSLFKFMGILAVIMLGLYAIIFVGSLFLGVFASM